MNTTTVLTGSQPNSSTVHLADAGRQVTWAGQTSTRYQRACGANQGNMSQSDMETVAMRPVTEVTCKSCLKSLRG